MGAGGRQITASILLLLKRASQAWRSADAITLSSSA